MQRKKQGGIPANNPELMSSQLMAKGVRVQEFEVDINDYKNYFNQSRYLEDYPEYYSGNLPEKSLEHYIASKLLGLSPDDIYIDVASESGVVPKIYHQVFGCQTYAQDLEYPPGLNGNSIGGDAGDMPIPNDFATKIGLHCSIEHFEGDADIRFAKELRRVLKFGGKCCIAPLYLFHEYAIQTDPVAATATGGVTFESDAIIYEHLGWNNRHGRFYDPEHLVSRIINNLNGFNITIYRIKNAKQVDNSCYIQFAAVLEKPLDDNTLGLDQHTTKINSSPNSSQHKSSLSHPVKKTVGKPNHFSSISTQPRIDVVLQATGTHGWNCSRGWVNVLQRQGLLNRVFTPMAEWGESGSTNDDGLYEYLRNPDADIMILLGFDWHSHPLHNNLKWREQWCNANIKKVAIFQEHCSADIVQNTPQWQEQISIAIDNAATCVSAIICNHEPDVSWLLNRGIKTPTVFSPFAIDPQYYNCQIPFTQRKNRAVFRGNATPHFNNKTYYQRSQLMDRLKPNHHVDLYPLVTDLLSKPLEAVQSYVDELNTYKLGLNLPSLSPTLTSRPYEIMGCGTLLLQNHVIGDKSNKLFRDWEHLVYYNPENPDDLIEKIEYLLKNPDLAEEIADRGYHLCQEKHTIECRVKELIEWTDSDFQVSENTPTISDATGQVILKSEGLSKTVNLHRQIKNSLLVAVDAVFFQLNDTGIARVWKHLLDEWAKDGFAKNILVIDRAGTAPKFSGFRYRRIPEYNYNDTDRDRQILQQVCDEEGVNIFISTYYTTPLSTPSVFMGYDMIPELIAQNLDDSMCQEKHQGIRHASAYLTISENTKRDLVGCFPNILVDSITVAHCGIDSNFTPASQEEIIEFTSKYEIRKPYFLVVGDRVGWRNTGYKNGILFFKAFAQLTDKHDFEIVCTGGDPAIEDKFLHYASGVKIHRLYLTDEDLRVAYSGAVALVYPSLYEGFGMPVLEAMACGCPVITCPYASLPEVGGNAVLYVSGRDVNEMAEAMIKVQQPEVRESLIRLGLEQSKQFSWSKMAEIVKSVLIETATDSLDNNSVELVRLPQEKSTSKDSNQEVLVVTSIAPRNIERQQACINTWQSLGFSVVSLNIQEEINQLQSLFPNVRFHAVWRDARTETERPLVYVEDIFMYLRGNGTKISGIINSDIYLNVDAGFVSFIAKEAIDNMVFGSRMDIDSLEDYQDGVLYDKGFDYFFFDKNLLEHYPPENFCMGMPWWDYWIPLVLLEKGIPIKLLISPIAYHVKHLMNFSEHRWIKFASYIASYYQSSSNYQQFFLQREFIDEGQEHQRLMNGCHELANKILQKIYQESSRICYFQDQIEDNFSQEVVSKPVTVFPENLRNNSQFLVSAIISTYNSEKYIRGCLQDLVDQTLYKQGKLQIVIVDSASLQNEQSIVKEFQAKYPNIVYERTPERETLYAAWNRAIKMSHGKYITNANTDDRHRFDALEVMANFLDTHPEVSLAYPNQLITTVANDTFVTTQSNRHWNWPPYSYEQMKQGCCVGSQPMWRKSLHDKYGYFRSEFHCAGDYEYWLRIGSKGEKLALVSEIIGLYYFNPQGIEHGTPGRAGQETDQICDEYGIKRLYIPKISGSERKFDDLQYQGTLLTDEEKANLIHHQQLAVNYQYETDKQAQNPLIEIITQPIVSVIIPTKNRPEMLIQAIQSVLNQTFTELEIIVVNDGGVDVQSVISRLNTRGNIVYKKHDHTLERSAARNTGIRAARGKYIAYLDDDDNYYPNHIETLVKFLENSEYKIAYTDAVMAQQEKQNGEYVTVHRSVPYSLDFDKDKILVSNCTPNLCLMHEKSCLNEVGLFDETLSTHEDWDLIIRLSRKFDIAHIKETTCEFTQRNDGTNTSSDNRADFTRTREIIFNRYRQYAEANPTILDAQKEAFIAEAKELAQQVQNLQSQIVQKESELQQNQAEKSQLSVQVETLQRSTQEVQAKLDATQSEKEWVKCQLNSWKQTAEEMQLELDRSLLKLKQAQ
jgi:glycosyltransferase involved in cell wall biosynthesis/SAM-dependent methyltransferase